MTTEVKIEFRGVPLKIVGDIEKGEAPVYYDSDMAGYPGSSDSLNIDEIYVKDSDVDIFDLFSYSDLELIKDLVFEEI